MNPSHIQTPPDETVIWRYMDTVKFFDLIQTSKLFFTRLDRFPDLKEGHLPNSFIQADQFVRDRAETLAKTNRVCICVNCWFMGTLENQRMWDEYVPGSGIALKSTVGRLKGALAGAEGEQFIGQVGYIDFDKGVCPLDGRDLTAAICIKDGSFQHENEVRAIVFTEDDGTPGERVPVDLNELIDVVVIHPKNHKDLTFSVVRRALKDYGVEVRVRHSQIDSGRAYTSLPVLGKGFRAEFGYMDLYVINEQQEHWRVLLFDAKRDQWIQRAESFKDEALAKEDAVVAARHHVTAEKQDQAPHDLDAIEWELLEEMEFNAGPGRN